MASERPVKVAIINRYYPNSVTGESAHELASYLNANSTKIEVNSISVNSEYKGGKGESEQQDGNYYISSFYHGSAKVFRLLANLFEGHALIKKAQKLNSDVVICLTDPPLLNFWASVLLKKDTPWYLWSMDLYPEAFVAAGLSNEKNLLYKFFKKKAYKNSPTGLIALGEYQADYLENTFSEKPKQTFLLPCGIHKKAPADKKPEWYDESKITFAYAGNLGEAHSDRFLKNIIESLDQDKHQLILSIYGSKSESIVQMLSDYPNVIRVKMLYKYEFSYIDVHVVSLLPEWTNVCVPSKAVSAICSGAPILFNGSKNSDTYALLNEASWHIPSTKKESDEKEMIDLFLSSINKERLNEKRIVANNIATDLLKEKSKTFQSIQLSIEGLNKD